ncbi:hypothetical protein ACFQH2_05640 [Natronoarchaeum sp. GCM10025703]|uniref:hypothetical protein n=1 Tax=unclassified Natronoarchaeum TaxID=2620183 RepID=UPI00360D43EE
MDLRTLLIVAALVTSLGVAGGVAATTSDGPVPNSDIATVDGIGMDLPSTPDEMGTATHTDPPVDAVDSYGAAETVAGAPSDTIDLSIELTRRPDSAGEVGVELQYRLPDRLTSLDARLFNATNVESTDGFTKDAEGRYVWDEETDTPTISYALSVDQELEQDGPIAGPGTYVFADTAGWTVMAQPRLSHGWGWRGGEAVGLDRTTTIDGPGRVGNRIAFLGEQETYTHEAHGQQFELVVPEAAALAESPDEIFTSVSHASDSLQVGSRDEEVFMLAVPTDEVGWGVRGLQTGGSDLWVRDNEVLDTADNVWVHEYVHTRQGYETSSDARWFTEATSTYYAALLTLEEERIGYEAFRERLDIGTRERHADAVLAEPGTWARGSNYYKGALAAGAVDRQLRLTTDGGASLQEPFSRMNEASEPVDRETMLEYVDAAGGDEPRETAARLTGTSETANVWSVEEHAAAFATQPARISYALPGDPDGIRVDGDYRERSLSDEEPITVVTGERLTIAGAVENTGESPGNYEARLRVDGEVVDRVAGRLAPGEGETVELAHRFEEAGERTIALGDDQRRVLVEAPATSRVTEVTRTPGRVAPGEDVTVTATVTNDNQLPGRADVTIRTDRGVIEETAVALDADGETTVTTMVSFDEPGTQRITVDDGTDDRSVNVRVASGGASGLITDLGDGSLGVGALTVVVLLVVLTASMYVFRDGQ